MVDAAVKKIRPADRELSMVQDNLANHLQQVVDQLNRVRNTRSIYMGTYSSLGGVMPTTDTALAHTTSNISRSTFNTTAYGETMASAGSVTAIKLFSASSFSGALYLTLYINSVPQGAYLRANGQSGFATADAGRFKFRAGDYLQLAIRADLTSTQAQVIGHLEIESQA